VLPGDPGVLLVQADGVGDLAGLAVAGGQDGVQVSDLARQSQPSIRETTCWPSRYSPASK
jgi:hypothetical protein